MRSIEAKWSDVLLVCRKCGKKLDGGFGKKDRVSLERLLKGQMKGKGAPRVLAVPCMDICPKGAVVVVKGSDPRQVHLVPAGAPVAGVIAALSGQPGSGQAGSGQPAPHQPAIGRDDQPKQRPAQTAHQRPAGKHAHDGAVPGEADQRPDGKGQLQR